MNKKLKLVCSSIVASMLVFTNFATLTAKASVKDDNIKVKSVIEQYFTNELKTMSTHKPVDSGAIISNESLKQYNVVKTDLVASWYKEIDETLKDYELYLDYNSIDFNDTSCEVNLIKGTDLIFEKSSQITQQSRGEEHTLVLKKLNNKWTISQDMYLEEGESDSSSNLLLKKEKYNLLNEEEYNRNLAEEVKELKHKKDNVKTEAEKLKNEKQKYISQRPSASILSYSGYNGNAARDYAYTYYKNYNPSYTDYSKQGGDCTNFVSQCLKAGGLPTDGTWFKDSNAWIRVIELRNWLVNKGYATEYSWQSNCKVGDVVQLQNSSKGIYTHSLLISYIDGYGQVYLAAHTNEAWNKAVYNYYPSSSWSAIRYLKITT